MALKKSDVVIGGVYRLRWHDGLFTDVKIIGERRYPIRGRNGVIGTKTRYTARNLKTNRVVEIKSASKLRERVA
jgi:hypothetical protein